MTYFCGGCSESRFVWQSLLFPAYGDMGRGGIFILKTKNTQTQSRGATRVKMIAILAILAAASVVFSRLIGIGINPYTRISLENLPIIFAGVVFGPIQGVAVALISDFLGCLMSGYFPYPLISVGSAMVGLMSGVVGFITVRGRAWDGIRYWRVLVPAFSAHLIGSIVIKSIGLWFMYKGDATVIALVPRVPIYIVNSVVEGAVICLLLRSAAIRASLRRFEK